MSRSKSTHKSNFFVNALKKFQQILYDICGLKLRQNKNLKRFVAPGKRKQAQKQNAFMTLTTATVIAISGTSLAVGQSSLPTGIVTDLLNDLTKTLTAPSRPQQPASDPDPASNPSSAMDVTFDSERTNATFIVKLSNSVDNFTLRKFLNDTNSTVQTAYPSLGQILIETDVSEFLPARQFFDTNEEFEFKTLEALLEAAVFLENSEIVDFAAPDGLLSGLRVEEEENQPIFTLQANTATSEVSDWGINNIQAPDVWQLSGSDEGVIVGVVDSGFNKHRDLIFSRFSNKTSLANHGNHVSGIICAQHNSIGVKGVVPHCFVRALAPSVTLQSDPSIPNSLNFYAHFSEIIAEFNDFLSNNSDVKTFNLSLGYNWISNFDINPDSPSAAITRKLVEAQGRIALSTYELAARNDIVIFSAAGNDSHGLAEPIDAKFASPFNWAATTMRDTQGFSSGVIIEAYDQTGAKASFSNKGGDLACPGVNILSTIAIPANSYALASGTSMASPYCAGGHALLTLVLKEKTALEIADCMIASADKSRGNPTGELRLLNAIAMCRQ